MKEKETEKKTRFVVWSHDHHGQQGETILGHVNTLAEGQKLLVERWRKRPGRHDDYEKDINEILSHTEEELIGVDNLTLYNSNCYFTLGISRVPGYVDEELIETSPITLGEILKRELAEVGKRNWEMKICKNKDEFYLKIEGCDKVAVGNKYENIVGMPTHHVYDYRVYSYMGDASFSESDFPDVDWNMIPAEKIDEQLKDYFLEHNKFYSREDAINSLPSELVLNINGNGTHSIKPYDEYGYHIEQISAYCTGVFIHIKKE